MNRLRQCILIGSTILGSWLGMQAVHEFGHVVGAWLTGGRVSRVVLNPLTISRTDLAENPSPLIVVWSGPLIGAAVPLLLWRLAAAMKLSSAFVLRFFAGFCLLANGSYIGIGSFSEAGDCGEMLRHGSPLWPMWLFGLITSPIGVALWHGQGRHFGLDRHATEEVNPRAVSFSLAACLVLVVLGLVVDGK